MRLKTTKTANTTNYYAIIDIKTKEGKRSTKIYKRLGNEQEISKISNGEPPIEWAKKQVAELKKAYEEKTLKIIAEYSQNELIEKDTQNLFNGGYLFLQDIYYDLGLDKICKSISEKYRIKYDLNSILSNLIYTRFIEPSSKLSAFETAKTLLEQPNFQLQNIYRALEVISSETENIEAEIYKNSLNVVNRNTKILYYDCTNYFFEIEEAEGLKQFGLNKENIVVCTDAGLASKENRMFNNIQDRSYIVTQSLKKIKGHLKEWALSKEGWHKLNSKKELNLENIDNSSSNEEIYYKERWINEDGLSQRLIVSYSPKYAAYQRHIRMKQIERAQNLINNPTKISKNKQNDPKRFIKSASITNDGEVASKKIFTLNQETIKNEEAFDGFYAVCTTLEDDISEIIKVNKRRWEIEESFRILKSDFKARPVYLKRDDRIKAHFTTCFLSLLIYRILEHKLKEKYSSDQIIKTLRNMNFLKKDGAGYIPTYMRTDLTDLLHEVFGFRTDTEIIPEKEIKKILNKTKK